MNESLEIVLDAVAELINEKFSLVEAKINSNAQIVDDIKKELDDLRVDQKAEQEALQQLISVTTETEKALTTRIDDFSNSVDARVEKTAAAVAQLNTFEEDKFEDNVNKKLESISQGFVVDIENLKEFSGKTQEDLGQQIANLNESLVTIRADLSEWVDGQIKAGDEVDNKNKIFCDTIVESHQQTTESIVELKKDVAEFEDRVDSRLEKAFERLDGLHLRIAEIDLREVFEEFFKEEQQKTVKMIDERFERLTGEVVREIEIINDKFTTHEKVDVALEEVNKGIKDSQDQLTELLNGSITGLKDSLTESIKEVEKDVLSLDDATAVEINAIRDGFVSKEKFNTVLEEANKEIKAVQAQLTASLESSIADLHETLNKAIEEARIEAEHRGAELRETVAATKDELLEKLDASDGAITEIQESFVGFETNIRNKLLEFELSKEQLLDYALEEIRVQHEGVEDWAHGDDYKKYAIVRRQGALWIANKRTKAVPGNSESWTLLADGVKNLQVEITDSGELSFVTELASGEKHTNPVAYKLPAPNPQGVYEESKEYAKYDAVIKDGHTFLSLVDNPGPLHENQKEWLCIGFRGKAGRAAKDVPTKEDIAAILRPQLVNDLTPELANMVRIVVDDIVEK